jgi:hypothetical protein
MLRPITEFDLIWKWIAIQKQKFSIWMGKNYGIFRNLGDL